MPTKLRTWVIRPQALLVADATQVHGGQAGDPVLSSHTLATLINFQICRRCLYNAIKAKIELHQAPLGFYH